MPGCSARSCDHAIDEPLERGLLGVEVVRPDALVARVCAPPTPQVLDPIVADVWVALEVEEHVARTGSGRSAYPAARLGSRWRCIGSAAVARLDLQRGLMVQQVEALGCERRRVGAARWPPSARTVVIRLSTSRSR